jgi:hypothetical protein
VISGSSVPGWMVYGGLPGMSKAMVSLKPTVALAALIASRSEQWTASHTPSSASSVVLTISVGTGQSVPPTRS